MTKQFSPQVRNAELDAIELTIGALPFMEIRSGAPPANTGASDTGTVLATLALPSDWLAAASAGVKSKSGTWQDLLADATGTAGHYRIKQNDMSVCHEQGTITATGGGGDMTVNNTSFAVNQPFEVTSFSYTAGNP